MTKMLSTIAVALALVAVTAGTSAIAGPQDNPSVGLYPKPLLGQVSAQAWEPPANRSRVTSGAL
jgi:hypothetical protein